MLKFLGYVATMESCPDQGSQADVSAGLEAITVHGPYIYTDTSFMKALS